MTDHTAEELDLSAFQQLPKLEQSLLHLLSVIYAPTAATPLAICARKVDIKNPAGDESFNLHSLKPVLQGLMDKGWITSGINRFACCAQLREQITLDAINAGVFEEYSKQILEAFEPRQVDGMVTWQDLEHGISYARIHLYRGDRSKLRQTLLSVYQQFSQTETPLDAKGFYEPIFGTPPDPQIMGALSPEILGDAFKDLAHSGMQKLQDLQPLWELLQKNKSENPTDSVDDQILETRTLYCLLTGQLSALNTDYRGPDISPARKLFNSIQQLVHEGSNAAVSSLTVDDIEAIVNLDHELTVLPLLAMTNSEEYAQLQLARTLLVKQQHSSVHILLQQYLDSLGSGVFSMKAPNEEQEQGQLDLLLLCLLSHWLGQTIDEGSLKDLQKRHALSVDANYHWLAAEYAQALALLGPPEARDDYAAMAKQVHEQLGTSTLFDLVQPKAKWERALDALNMLADHQIQSVRHSEERLIWLLDKDSHDNYSLSPKIQKRKATGGWSKGRTLSLSRLKLEYTELSHLSDKDIELCNLIQHRPDFDAHTGAATSYIDMNTAWPVLVNHPALYWDQSRFTPLEVVQSEFELLVNEEGDKLRISFYPPVFTSKAHDQYVLQKETPTRLCIYRKNEQVMRLHDILSQGLLIPREAEAQLRETLSSLAPMISIQSDLEGVVDAEPVEADSRIHANLLPYGEGLRATLRVKPFGNFGPLYPPGQGRKKLVTEHYGEKYQTERDLALETERQASITEGSLVLTHDEEDYDDEYLIDDPQDCLELLEQLRELGDEVVIAWPEGEALRVESRIDGSSMRLNINKSDDWFQLDGSLVINDDLVLTLQQILDLSKASNGRFIELGDGEYVALTKQLQKKLNALHSLSETHDGQIRISSLAALALDELTEDIGERIVDDAWIAHLAKLESLKDFTPAIPDTLDTELRDYQEQGYQWLCRLAEWGVGACLADDMGLGKTIQTLALILNRTEQGPSLVVAPTSVCNNWMSETEKFAPSLNPIFYRGKDRSGILENAGPQDLVISSYGLLQQDAEQFISKQWTTIVLDEAQAIKNVGAKRTRTAHQLKSDFRLVTTGTPIENHLGELWSLFRFLNPGLLHTQDQFMKRFMLPIERDKNSGAREALKSLIQPFMLRRTKSQVLNELPPRTEITLEVPLSEGERALYEAVRLQAIEGLEPGEKEGGGDHLKVLAAITRLRMASCNPRLVMPETTLPSSKLEQFATLLDELLENNHKALVFSQFVKHLSLIREHLDHAGISYQYLDGSTSMAQRKERVDAFQAGEGDVFLISLKAGGSGLNLTEADYVVHMDPWWNPAVEDQASDRAHRIGQTRPVTIYRLVAENTIEQKIIKLHQQKRDLADSLLDGSDISGSLNAKEMLALIRDI
ncbi:DEAD/DEAH box helicase [Leucothrix pacifica]|uniref:Helicase n=1 Tax=Leucothrix pacifica TaxID=1247513 RepID=A0A317CGQ6_9GAMM|nr:DEAD/DEAH box helicase [Leucothrix pacifica]PWQ97716.1 helicase [Leucothrix pacifica]